MIENIVRFIEMGDKPLDAALKGAEQIGFTIMSLTVSLVAVLIPLLFMSDIVGRLFREFAVTLSVTILVSAVVSLTLTPMMCARLLRRSSEKQQGRVARASEQIFDRVIAFYGRTLRWVLDRRAATLAVAVLTLVLTIVLYVIVPKGFFPGAGHGGGARHFAGGPECFLHRHGGQAAGAGQRSFSKTRRWPASPRS